MKDLKIHITFFFLIAAMLFGLLLRLQIVFPVVDLQYKNVLHGHSHVAMLGWGFNSLFLAIIYAMFDSYEIRKRFNIPFWFAQFTILGAMISFPIQGYKLYSIVFSTLFLVATYWLVIVYFKVNRALKVEKSPTNNLIKWGLRYMLISGIGPLALGILVAKGLKDTDWYPLSVYFYLHFFYNGFFILVIVGLFLRAVEKSGIKLNFRHVKNACMLLNFSILPTFALSTLWMKGTYWLNVTGILGAGLQILVLVYLFRMLWPVRKILFQQELAFTRIVFYLGALSLGIKIGIQFLSGFETIAIKAFEWKNFLIIGYIHLIMLGIIIPFGIGYFVHLNLLRMNRFASMAGLLLFIAGFVLTEVLLLGQGIMLATLGNGFADWYWKILICSVAMPLGIMLIYFSSFFSKHPEEEPIEKSEQLPSN